MGSKKKQSAAANDKPQKTAGTKRRRSTPAARTSAEETKKSGPDAHKTARNRADAEKIRSDTTGGGTRRKVKAADKEEAKMNTCSFCKCLFLPN